MFSRPVVTSLVVLVVAGLPWMASAERPLVRVNTRPLRHGEDSGGVSRIAPDPPALVERQQWVFDLRYVRGELSLLGIRRFDRGVAVATPRMMGRFALELFEGPALVERVRFDFPLLGAGLSDSGLERGLSTRIGVVFPATARGIRLELLDRATDRRWPLPWPVEEKPVHDAAGGG
ncbi:MAG: hypothetical protein WCI05_10265 [Myxococcales bacterium]